MSICAAGGKTRIYFRISKALFAFLLTISLSLQLSSLFSFLKTESIGSINENNNNVVHVAVDEVGGKPVAIKFNYAHFVQLTNNS